MDGFAKNANGDLRGTVYGRVVEKQQYEDGVTGLVLDRLSIGGEEEDGKLIAYLPASSGNKIRLADKVELTGRTGWQDIYYENSFQAKRVKKQIRFSMQAESVEIVGRSFSPFLAVRQRAEDAIGEGMDGETGALIKALLFGNTYGVDEGLYENIRMGGIAHIFAVSGLHMGALFGFCLLLFRKTSLSRLPKLARFFLIAGICFFYAGVCGFTSSVVRALVMCLLLYGGKLIGVKTDFLENIGVAGIILLLCSPVSFFEAGFQLSFTACIGIGVLSKPIGQVFDEIGIWYKTRILKIELGEDKPMPLGEQAYEKISSFLSVSLSAQIFTTPLLMYYFGYFSPAGLLLNCIFIPLMGGVFGVLLSLVFIASCLPLAVAKAVLFVPNSVTAAVMLLFDLVDFSLFAVQGIRVGVLEVLLWFLACSFASFKWNVKAKTKIWLFFACIGSMALVNIIISLAF